MNDIFFIKSIHLTNFRNYKNTSLDLGKKTTIIIGRNGAGKTNMITAIKQSLSFIFSKKKDAPQYNFVASSDQKVKSFLPTDPYYVDGDYRYPVVIGTEVQLYEDANLLSWEFRKQSADKSINESYVTACVKFWKKVYNTNKIPVFAFFSDSYPHIQSTMGKNMQDKLDSGNPLPQNTAYYKWDDERNCTELWKQYFVMNWKNARFDNDNKAREKYCDAIEKALVTFTEPISNHNNPEFALEGLGVEARGKEDVLIVKYRNGRRVPFDMLPQGYKRILSIVFDIAHRGYLLQQNCNPYAVIFIDEVELHLHPSLAQEIVQRFRRSFSNAQMIISTHSPLVIADYKQDNNNLLYSITLSEEGPEFREVKNMYGMNYISVLQSVMETPERDSYLQNLSAAYKYWKQLGDTKRMRQLETSIKRLTGEESEFYKSLVE
mgnify:FL=1